MKNFSLSSLLILSIAGVIYAATLAGDSMASNTRSTLKAAISHDVTLSHEIAMLEATPLPVDSIQPSR